MTLNVLKTSLKKQKARVFNYRNYNFYNNKFFLEQFFLKLNNNLSKQDRSLKRIQETLLTVLNSITPLKRKFIKANHTPVMNKKLQQAIMIRSKLPNKFLKSRSVSDKNAYNKQINARVKKETILFKRECKKCRRQ